MRVIRNDRQLPEDIANLTDELQTNLWLCCNKLRAAHASIPQEIMLLNYRYGHVNVTCVYERQMMQSEFLNKTTNLTYSAFHHILLLSTATCSELPHANTILNNPCDALAESGQTHIQHVKWKFEPQNAQDSVLGVDPGKVFTAAQV